MVNITIFYYIWRENSLRYERGRNPCKFELGLVIRPLLSWEEVHKTTTIGRAESLAIAVTLTSFPLQMIMYASKEGEAILVWFPHILKLRKFFSKRKGSKRWVVILSSLHNSNILFQLQVQDFTGLPNNILYFIVNFNLTIPKIFQIRLLKV